MNDVRAKREAGVFKGKRPLFCLGQPLGYVANNLRMVTVQLVLFRHSRMITGQLALFRYSGMSMCALAAAARNLSSALDSSWRMRSLVTPISSPTCLSVNGSKR